MDPNFKPAKALLKLFTTIWIRLPLLPIEYQSPQTLILIGNLIRRTMALDASKSTTLQVATTRIYIEVDIKSRLPQVIISNGLPQEFLYKNLYFFLSILSLLPPPSFFPVSPNFLAKHQVVGLKPSNLPFRQRVIGGDRNLNFLLQEKLKKQQSVFINYLRKS